MDNAMQKQTGQDDSSSGDEEQKIAVPYTPPPPPANSSQKKFKSPVVNGVIIALVILLGGFMAYNFVGHQLTQLAGESDVRTVSPTLSTIPSDTPVPSVSISPTSSQ